MIYYSEKNCAVIYNSIPLKERLRGLEVRDYSSASDLRTISDTNLIPSLKSKLGKSSFSYAGPKAWNDLSFSPMNLLIPVL